MSTGTHFNIKKYGGESVDNTCGAFAMQDSDKSSTRLAVVSAFSGVTNQLFTIAAGHSKKRISPMDFTSVIDRSLNLLRNDNHAAAQTAEQAINQILAQTVATHADCTDSLIQEDMIVGLGERISALVVASHWNIIGARDQYVAVDLADLVDRTALSDTTSNKKMLFAALEAALYARLAPVLASGKTPVITGYLGILPGGIMAHMDRGYSDSTAVLVARALVGQGVSENRARVEICKTVSGILSTDPNLFDQTKYPLSAAEDPAMPKAVLRAQVSKSVIAKAASSGAKVVNAVAAHLLETSPRVDAVVRHTFEPKQSGTLIVNELAQTEKPGLRVITGKLQRRVTLKNTSAVNAKDWLSRIFAATELAGISVNVVESPDNTCTIWMDEDRRKLELVTESLQQLGTIADSHVVGLITCLEDGKRPLRESNIDMQKIFTVLLEAGIDVLDFSANSGSTVTLTVEGNQMAPCIRALHSRVVVLEN